MDLTLRTEQGYFNHRVSAVIINDNKILAQRNTKDNTYYLVGGRVQFGETTEEALVRELKEELNIEVKTYQPLWINEHFFNVNSNPFHEIGMYYIVDICNTGFIHYEKSFEKKEQDRTNCYEWIDIDELDNIVLYPIFIKEEIKNIDNKLKLIITKETQKWL